MRPDTILVSVMLVNNEIGVVQPIKEIGELCRSKGIIFHSDAAQATGKVPGNVKARFKLKDPHGKIQTHDGNIPARLSKDWAKKKGVKIDRYGNVEK